MKKSIKTLLILGVLVVIMVLHLVVNNNKNIDKPTDDLEIYFLDVGQGDSTLIKLPNGENVLIDGGKKSVGKDLVIKLNKLGISKLDYLVATHPHEDHIGGLPEVIRNLDVDKFYLPKKINTTKIFEELLMEVKERDIETMVAKANIQVLKSDKLNMEFIGPAKAYKDINNNSAVLSIKYGDFRGLFMGDGEKELEREIIESGIDLNSQLIKIGHHGSKTSTTKEFLEKVKPEYAFISVGKNNKYSHPDDIVINRLKNYGVKIFRTDEFGSIKVTTDGSKITIERNIRI